MLVVLQVVATLSGDCVVGEGGGGGCRDSVGYGSSDGGVTIIVSGGFDRMMAAATTIAD